jgi:hypothetical protein
VIAAAIKLRQRRQVTWQLGFQAHSGGIHIPRTRNSQLTVKFLQ